MFLGALPASHVGRHRTVLTPSGLFMISGRQPNIVRKHRVKGAVAQRNCIPSSSPFRQWLEEVLEYCPGVKVRSSPSPYNLHTSLTQPLPQLILVGTYHITTPNPQK